MFLIRILVAMFFVAFFLGGFSAKAADYTNNDLSAPITDATNYNNVTVSNSRILSSGSVTGGYVYFGGTVDGDINFTNSSSGSITSTHSNYGVFYMPNVGNTLSQKSISITNDGSLTTSGGFANTIYILGKLDGSFPSFTRRSFDFSLNNSGTISSAASAAYIVNGNSGSFSITNSGTISSSGTGYQAIALSGGDVATITNSGTIQANSASETAISISSTSATITNSGTITGSITTTSTALDVINNAGTITGNIVLGNNSGSSLEINGGTISGNVTMNNSSQTLTFGGGTLNGTVNGAGAISVTANTVLNGNIGASTSLTSLTLSPSITLDALTNNNSIRATNITLNSGSILSMGNGALTGSVDGSANGRGTLNMTFSTNSNVDAVIGSNKTLAAVNFTANSSAMITANNTINASEVSIRGVDGALILASLVGINGNVVIGNNSNLLLGNNSFVSGTVSSETDGSGTYQIDSSSTISASSDIGTASKKLGNITVGSNSTLTTSAALRANTISIGSNAALTSSSTIIGDFDLSTNATLNLQDGSSVNGTINPGGIVEEGIVNSFGAVTILGEIGNSGPIKSINVASGSQLSISNNNNSGINSITSLNTNITGQLNLIDQTTINGNMTMIGAASKINLSGKSQTINGNFTSSSGSTIASTIHSTTAIDKLTVLSSATISSGTKLALTISGGITPGSSYTIIDGNSGSSINTISNSDINVNGGSNRFGKYIFTTLTSGDDLLLNSSLASLTTTNGNRSTVYDNIANDNSGNSGALYTMQEYIFGDASDTAKNTALDSTLPQVDNSANRISFNSAQESLNMASNRLQNFNRISAIKSEKPIYVASNDISGLIGTPTNNNLSVWAQTFGSNISQGNTNSSAGYKANLKGLAFGADKAISDNTYFGLGLSYANSAIKSRDGLKHTSVDAYQLNAYHSINCDKLFWNNLVGLVWNEYSSSRAIPTANVTAASKYYGQTYIGRSEIGINKELKNDFIFTPTFTITAARNSINNYSEEGAGTLDLRVKSKSANFFETRGGIALKKNFNVLNYTVIPEIFASYGYDFAGSKQKTSSNFIGQTTSFDSSASNIARGNFRTGLSNQIYNDESLSFNLDYTYEKRLNYHANSAILKMSYKF